MTRHSSLSLAALLITSPLLAQTTGTAHPEDIPAATDTAAADDTSHYVKPSAATPALRQHPDTTVVYGPYKPYVPATPVETAEVHHSNAPMAVTDDPNSGVVVDVPTGEHELPIGTTIRASLKDDISTRDTAAGTNFSAVLSTDVEHNGKVLLPSGSIVYGRVTQVRGGSHFGKAAAIRLQPDTVTLPDGTTYRIQAEVTDLDNFRDSHVGSEGAILANSNAKATVAALSLTTTSAVIAGAMIGGGVGAVVGLGVGAGAGAIWWLKKDRQETLPRGTEIVFMLDGSLQLNSN
jgi:hypothetical protein